MPFPSEYQSHIAGNRRSIRGRDLLFIHFPQKYGRDDIDGNPLGYCGRRLDPDEASRFGKWRFPKNFPKAQILYNAHRASGFHTRGIVLVECPWAVMRIAQAGFPNAVALLGTSLSKIQINWLSNANFILIMLDGDPAENRAALSISNTLDPSVKMLQHQLPDNMEPEDLPESSLRSILQSYFPFS